MNFFLFDFFDISKCVKDAIENRERICTQETKHHSLHSSTSEKEKNTCFPKFNIDENISPRIHDL
jgi:hypothetical protein